MTTEIITPPDDGTSKRKVKITCEFCECTLTADGEILKRGAKARAMLDLEDSNAKLTDTIAKRDARIAELEAAAATIEPVAAGKKSSGSIFDY
jgi:hypothetical protein